MKSILIKKQTKRISKVLENGNVLDIDIRYDDECNNGRNSFSITGTLFEKMPRSDRNTITSGCIHDTIVELAPEYSHLIKWHFMSSDGPMHYLANTLYHAGDKDYNGRRKGEPSRIEKYLLIGNSPIKYKASKRLLSFVEQYKANREDILVFEKFHPREPKTFTPNYCFYQDTQWHEAMFNNINDAKDFRKALETCEVEIVDIVTDYSQGKERELDAARSSAIWPDATDEELCSDNLKELLINRLPALINEFQFVIKDLGFTF